MAAAVAAAVLGQGCSTGGSFSSSDRLRLQVLYENPDVAPGAVVAVPDSRRPVVVAENAVLEFGRRWRVARHVLLSEEYSTYRGWSSLGHPYHIPPCVTADGRILLTRQKPARSRDDAGNMVVKHEDELVLMDVHDPARIETIISAPGAIDWFDARLSDGRGMVIVGWSESMTGSTRVLVARCVGSGSWETVWSSDRDWPRFVGLYGVVDDCKDGGLAALIYGLSESLPKGEFLLIQVPESGEHAVREIGRSVAWTPEERKGVARNLHLFGHMRTEGGIRLVFEHDVRGAYPETLVADSQGRMRKLDLGADVCGLVDASDGSDAMILLSDHRSHTFSIYDVGSGKRVVQIDAGITHGDVELAIPCDFDGDGSRDVIMFAPTMEADVTGLPGWQMGIAKGLDGGGLGPVVWNRFSLQPLSVQVVDLDENGRDEIVLGLDDGQRGCVQILGVR
ncbi:hypothetical protein MX659_04175 [Coriobacteriia bacterium Es71-Z0120]|uniref:hypothetical protein n=1 Tax=Parvivirga hydrogeniphila TaxID=2939460 RepID=UPI002260EE8A|nr:hypothetical protein [Parvivirga hydrogeniphila]MCL4078796.1 hypothetical protein [Parvivirga hydrogeniphila]